VTISRISENDRQDGWAIRIACETHRRGVCAGHSVRDGGGGAPAAGFGLGDPHGRDDKPERLRPDCPGDVSSVG